MFLEVMSSLFSSKKATIVQCCVTGDEVLTLVILVLFRSYDRKYRSSASCGVRQDSKLPEDKRGCIFPQEIEDLG